MSSAPSISLQETPRHHQQLHKCRVQQTIKTATHADETTNKHNIISQTKFNLNTMAFLGETTTQTIANSRLTFIFLNGLITHNQTGVYFQSPTPTPM